MQHTFEILNRRSGHRTPGQSASPQRTWLTLVGLLRAKRCLDRTLQREFTRDGEHAYIVVVIESHEMRAQLALAAAERDARLERSLPRLTR